MNQESPQEEEELARNIKRIQKVVKINRKISFYFVNNENKIEMNLS